MPFCLRIPILGPLPLSVPLHLDGLLHALMVREGFTEPDHVNLPLEQENSVYRASAAFFCSGVFPVRERIATVSLLQWSGLDDFVEYAGGDIRTAIRMKNMKAGSNELRRSTLVYADEVVFYAVGDAEGVGEFLKEHLEGLGKNRLCPVDREGIVVHPMTEDRSWIWNGTPSRALPLPLWTGSDDCSKGMVSFCPPYWKTEKQLCAVPGGRGGVLKSLEVLE